VFATVIGTLAVMDAILGGLVLRPAHDDGRTGLAAAPLPRITIPAPPTPAARTLAPARAQRQAAKARPPVLLGPAHLAASLTAYCRAQVSGALRAGMTGDGWQCARALVRPVAIDMDAACRWLYGEDAWSGMIDDTDQRTWRCYRDPS
jgi:hypothetical protein